MNTRRVAITGLGAVTALGLNVPQLCESLRAGHCGIRPIETVECTRLRFKNGAEVGGFTPTDHFTEKELDHLDRFAQLGLVAAREAVRDAAVEWTPTLRENAAVITGSCLGGKISEDQTFAAVYGSEGRRAHPLAIPRAMANAAASQISMEFGILGPTYTISTACASATHAIGQAFALVRSGAAEMAVTGGSEAPFALGHLKKWEGLRVVSPDTCRPFSKDRRGMILGEAGAMLVLEPLDAALNRGARVYAEVVGFGMSSDAHHLTLPSAEGAARAITAALRDAGISPEQVGYVNAHGTGTKANDPVETQALRLVFREHAARLAVSSTKSMHGHSLGATGAVEAVATALALHEKFLPPTANFTEPDPECDLDYVPNEARRAEVEYAISNSFAFGGLNAVLVLRRWDGEL
ncbi:MAG TPA: beta-ketoacyl-[acyl-carrier-protein] synthase family protein [Pyrinomonadaceae bacterium]|nr:beta-ketoacyl-[acyl-carrier-protein] synthase family protein [Pyrinomonadaceae bacterium]